MMVLGVIVIFARLVELPCFYSLVGLVRMHGPQVEARQRIAAATARMASMATAK